MMIHECPECGEEMEVVRGIVEWGSPADTYPHQMDMPIRYDCPECEYSEEIDPSDLEPDYD